MRHSLIATILVILLAIPITWILARNISGPLRQLAGEAEAIRRFEFSQPIKVNSLVLEVNDLSLTMDSMKRTIRRFLDISMAVAAENDFDKLLPRLLTETLSAADADAGILYLADGDKLVPVAALQRRWNTFTGRCSGSFHSQPPARCSRRRSARHGAVREL